MDSLYQTIRARHWNMYLVNYTDDEDNPRFDPFTYMEQIDIQVPVLKMNDATANQVLIYYYPYMVVFLNDSVIYNGEPQHVLPKIDSVIRRQ